MSFSSYYLSGSLGYGWGSGSGSGSGAFSSYSYGSGSGSGGSSTFSFGSGSGSGSGSGGSAGSGSGSGFVNTPPDARNDSAATNENQSVRISVLSNDFDANGDALRVIAASGGSNGRTSVNGDGTITYTPNADFDGTDTFTYTISDGNGGRDTATVTVRVNNVNSGPDARADAASTDEDQPVVISVLANDLDPDGDTVRIVAAGDGSNGQTTVNANGTITYTPDADFNGADSFTYTISDGNGGRDTATVEVNVAPVNDAPDAQDDTFTTTESEFVAGDLLANDSDQDGDALTIIEFDGQPLGAGVTLTSAGGRIGQAIAAPDGTLNFAFDPDGGFEDLGAGETDTVSVSYTVSDGNGATDTAQATVTIVGENDPPIAEDDVITMAEDEIGTDNLLENDFDPDGDPIVVIAFDSPDLDPGETPVVGQPAFVITPDQRGGNLTVNQDGTLTFEPLFGFDELNAGETVQISVSYVIQEEGGDGATDTADVTIVVEGVGANVAPFIPEPVVFFAEEEQTLAAVLQAIDPEGDAITFGLAGGPDGNLVDIDPVTGVVTFLDAPDFENPGDADGDNRYQIEVSVSDAFNMRVQPVAINVTNIDDTPNTAPEFTAPLPPVAGDPLRFNLFTNSIGVITDLDATDADGDSFVFSIGGEDANRFEIDALSGEISLTETLTDPPSSFDGDLVFEVFATVTDVNGATDTQDIEYLLFLGG